MVIAALRRLDETAAPVLPVAEPALRGLTGTLASSSSSSSSSSGLGPAAAAASPAVDHRPVAGPPPAAPAPRTAVTSGHAWTAEADEELRDAVDAGVGLEELCDHLELTPDVVSVRLEQLGLRLGEATLGFGS